MVMGSYNIINLDNFEFDYDLVVRVAKKLTQKLDGIPYECTIIHGDVSASNVFITPKNEIVLIDWIDCRVDVGISDFSQAIHLMRLNAKQRSVFLNTYDHALNFPLFIQFQLLMHCLYDLIAKLNKNKPYGKELNLFNESLAEIHILL